MRDHILDELPFYINGTLSGKDRALADEHLRICPTCQTALREWQAIAHRMIGEAFAQPTRIPPLSPLTWASRHPRSLRQAVLALKTVVWAQRPLILRGWLLTGVCLAILLGVIASASLVVQANYFFALPLMLLVPCLAVIAVASIHTFEDDPLYEIIAAAPTPAANLIFARFTLALCVVALPAFFGSILLNLLGAGSLGSLIFTWLGPLLILSGLATFLSLFFGPPVASGLPLLLWVGLISLLATQSLNRPDAEVWLAHLLHPGAGLVLAQLVCAGLVWAAGWAACQRQDQFHSHLEAGR
jgi:hypothetical protein